MIERNKTVSGLLVLAIVCAVVAGLGAVRATAQSFIVPNASCATHACNNLSWGNPPHDSAGNPLPVGASCTMSSASHQLCVATPGPNCLATAMIPNGCNGFYMHTGPSGIPASYACYQTIHKC